MKEGPFTTPDGRISTIVGQASNAGAVCIHHVNIMGTASIRAEGDAPAVGRQAGALSAAGWLVRRLSPEPSAFMT